MKPTLPQRSITLWLLSSLLLALLPFLSTSAPTVVAASSSTDGFGYTFQTSSFAEGDWVDACADGTKIDFADLNNAVSAGLPIGFDNGFPFYEESYTQLWVTTNGLISFISDPTLANWDNDPIPMDVTPNALIAPFWDNLTLDYEEPPTNPDSEVCYYETSTQFVVEWYQIALYSQQADRFTFEAILEKSGAIQFLYQSLPSVVTSASVGIEDGDGLFGLQAYHDEAGLAAGQKLIFSRPTVPAGAKFLQTFHSGFFTKDKLDLSVDLRNITDIQPLTFDLCAHFDGSSTITPDLTVEDNNGNPLMDSNHNGCPEVVISDEVNLIVHLVAPENAGVGDFVKIILEAKPLSSAYNAVTMEFQAAVPADFAQAYATGGRMRLDLTSASAMRSSQTGDWYSGRSLAMMQTANGGYFYAWQRITGHYSYIQGSLLSPNGSIIFYEMPISPSKSGISDQSPVVAALPDGKNGVAFTRAIEASGSMKIILRIIDQSGKLVGNEIEVAQTNSTIVQLHSLRAAVGNNNRFYLVWVGESNLNISDLWLAVVDSNGNVIVAPRKITSSSTDIQSFSPQILAINNKVLVAYSKNEISNKQIVLNFQVFDSSGNLSQSETALSTTDPGIQARGVDMVEINQETILAAWTEETSSQIQYTVLHFNPANGKWGVDAPQSLITNYLVGAENVSVTTDQNGHGILTWMERRVSRSINYALVSSSGELITPPMISIKGNNNNPVLSNADGQGNAPYTLTFNVSIPVVQR